MDAIQDAPGQVKIYTPTPTIARCMRSPAIFRLLVSGRGEGKSSGSLMTIVTHAQKQDPARWPLKFAALRDTRRNLGLTTAATIKEWFPEGLASFWVGKDLEPEYAQIRLHPEQNPVVEFFFFGCDNPRDYSKFQSFECDGVWMEEPAPAADISGGIPGDALAIAVTSMRKSAQPLVIIAENPPDGSDWTAQTWNLPGAEPTDWDLERQEAIERIRAQSEVFIIPKGENYHLDIKTPGYRERNRDMLLALGHADLVARLVEGKVGNVKIGEPVASNFRDEHLVDAVPPVQRGERLITSWDPKHSPACILWRVRPGGFCDIIAAFQGVNMGVKQLIEKTIRPWLALYVPDEVTFIHTGDPNTTNEDQSDSAMSAARVIIDLMGGEQWVPGPVSIEDRRLPMHDVLNRYHNGRPWVRIDRRHSKVLISALQGGWHYGRDPTGRVIKDRWVKSQACVDAHTEMLTSDGWKTFDAISPGDACIAYDLDAGVLTDSIIEKVFSYEESSRVVHFKNNALDMIVTPNHKALVTCNQMSQGVLRYASPFLKPVEQLLMNDYVVRSAEFPTHEESVYTDEFVRLCAWVLSEGYYETTYAGFRLSQSATHNPVYCDFIDRLGERFGAKRYRKNKDGTQYDWVFPAAIGHAVRALFPDKVLTPAFCFALTSRQRWMFLYEFVRGDGEWARSSHGPVPDCAMEGGAEDFWQRGGVPRIWQKSHASIDCLQLLATLAGCCATLRKAQNREGWRLTLHRNKRKTFVRDLQVTHETLPFVWCPQTTHSTWVARRNGYVFLTGNSDVGEAFAYGCAMLTRRELTLSATEKWRRKVSQMNRDHRLRVVHGTGA